MKEEKTVTATVTTKNKLSEHTQVIWDQLKGLPTEFFGLKNITLADVLTPLNLDQDKLFLKLKAPAALCSLEESLAKLVVKTTLGDVVPRYVVESVKGMAVVSVNSEL